MKGRKVRLERFVKEIIDVEIMDKIHAHCEDIITRKDLFEPMLVLSTYFEPKYFELYEAGEITDDYLHNHGAGYVDAVGIDGRVRRLNDYEYYILNQSELSEEWKHKIKNTWECENITYRIRECLKHK